MRAMMKRVYIIISKVVLGFFYDKKFLTGDGFRETK